MRTKQEIEKRIEKWKKLPVVYICDGITTCHIKELEWVLKTNEKG